MSALVVATLAFGPASCGKGAPPGPGPSASASAPSSATAPAQDNWPQFRGPGGMGLVPAGRAYPVRWDANTRRNIAWKIDLPAFGHSSPIVWGDRLFLTGESNATGHVLCIDRATGNTLWNLAALSEPGPYVSGDMGAGLCAPTPATDGGRVYALFSSGDVVCVGFDGNVVWKRHVCDPVNSFGLSGSPVLWKDTVILQLDQGNSEDDGLSVVLAVEKATGKTRWSTKRPVPNSWSTPLLLSHRGRNELITCASPFVIAYDPDSGGELWRVKGLGGDVVPTPVCAGGRVFAASAGSSALAILPGGRGDVTGTHIAWSKDEGLPSMASPLTDGRWLLLCEAGELTCYDARTGQVAWRQTAGEAFYASPALVGRNVYLPDHTGKMLIFELGDKFKLISTPDVHDEITASPAFADGKIYLRTRRSLFCIAED